MDSDEFEKWIRQSPNIEAQRQNSLAQLKRRQVCGSYGCALLSLQLLRNMIGSCRWSTAAQLMERVRYLGAELAAAQPMELAIGNMVRRVLYVIREEYTSLTAASAESSSAAASGGGAADALPPPPPHAPAPMTLYEVRRRARAAPRRGPVEKKKTKDTLRALRIQIRARTNGGALAHETDASSSADGDILCVACRPMLTCAGRVIATMVGRCCCCLAVGVVGVVAWCVALGSGGDGGGWLGMAGADPRQQRPGRARERLHEAGRRAARERDRAAVGDARRDREPARAHLRAGTFKNEICSSTSHLTRVVIFFFEMCSSTSHLRRVVIIIIIRRARPRVVLAREWRGRLSTSDS